MRNYYGSTVRYSTVAPEDDTVVECISLNEIRLLDRPFKKPVQADAKRARASGAAGPAGPLAEQSVETHKAMALRRPCLLCETYQDQTAFSAFQWGEGRMAKCKLCVAGIGQGERDERRNDAADPASLLAARQRHVRYSASASLHDATEVGALGYSAAGSSQGAACSAKWYRDMPRSSEDEGMPIALGDRGLYRLDMKTAQRALRVVEQWNAQRLLDVNIELQTPQVMRVVTDDAKMRRAASAASKNAALGGGRAHRGPGLRRLENDDVFNPARQVLVKPAADVRGAKFGAYAAGGRSPPWSEALQALSHYSYASSGGEILLCGLSGTPGIVSEYVVHSRGQTYGPTDLGADGIRNFFARHVCNGLCKGMARPKDAELIFPPARGGVGAAASPLVQPRGLPPRVTPPPHSGLLSAGLLSAHAGDFFIDSAAMAQEAEERRAASIARDESEARALAARSKAAKARELAAAERAAAQAQADLNRMERFNGINGITGMIGRQATTRQRPTTQELLQGRREWPRGSGRWVYEDPQGWRALEKIEDMMKAPNNGSFYIEPEPEEEGAEEEGAEEEGGGTT